MEKKQLKAKSNYNYLIDEIKKQMTLNDNNFIHSFLSIISYEKKFTFEELRDILFYLHNIDITDDSDYNVFNLIVAMRDNLNKNDFYELFHNNSYDQFIIDNLQEYLETNVFLQNL